MKSGVIIYVVGKEPANWDADYEMMTIKQNTKADLVEIITAQSGHFDVLDAWWSLITKGMQHITCMIGEFSSAGNLTLTGRKLRICG
jgi:hypothetical protein